MKDRDQLSCGGPRRKYELLLNYLVKKSGQSYFRQESSLRTTCLRSGGDKNTLDDITK
jgi:hypothetical protein